MTKVLVLLGSLRDNSNSSHYAKAFLGGLSSKTEIEVKTINLTEQKINGCTECYACVPHNELFCPQKDSFIPIAKEFVEADIVLFVYPVFWFSIPGEVKNFIDRMICVMDFSTMGSKQSFHENFNKKMVVCMPNCMRPNLDVCEKAAYPIEQFCEMYGLLHHSVYLTANQMDASKNITQLESAKEAGIFCFSKISPVTSSQNSVNSH